MPEIKVFRAADGRITIRWPKGQAPDRSTLERLHRAISGQKKNPSACANMRKGSAMGTRNQDDSNARKAESQELFQQLDPEEQKEAVRFMRELIGSRA